METVIACVPLQTQNARNCEQIRFLICQTFLHVEQNFIYGLISWQTIKLLTFFETVLCFQSSYEAFSRAMISDKNYKVSGQETVIGSKKRK
jgi:hypothetical protein